MAATNTLNPIPGIPAIVRPATRLFGWGAGNFGQFAEGPSNTGEVGKPRRNKWIEEQIEQDVFGPNSGGLESVESGGTHSLLLDERGTVWSCGSNDDAALGRATSKVPDPKNPGTFIDSDLLEQTPTPIQSLVDEGFRAVRIAAGNSICAAIDDQGRLRVWGHFRGNEGSLGFSSDSKHQLTPIPILELPAGEACANVVAGSNHLVVLTTTGNIYTWGAGEESQLGRRILQRHKMHGTVPEKVVLPRRRKAVVVGTGSYHSFAVDHIGDVWGWGLNSVGQTGTGFHRVGTDDIVVTPLPVRGLSKEELGGTATIIQIKGGGHHTLFLDSLGRVYSCGKTIDGQLGLPDDSLAFADRPFPGFFATPVQIVFPDKDDPIVQVSVGIDGNAAVSQSGVLYTWGGGEQSELGLGRDVTQVKTPTVIVRQDGSWAARQVSCGGQHVLALLEKR